LKAISGQTLNLSEENWSGRRSSNSQLSAWECSRVSLCFQHLQKRLEKMLVHDVHHVP